LTQEARTCTPRDLRADIRAAELAVAALRRRVPAESALELLELLDRIAVCSEHLGEAGVDLRAELAQMETVSKTVTDKRRIILNALSALGGLATLRVEASAPEDRWWWYLDQQEKESRTSQAKRMLRLVVGAGAVLAVLVVLYVIFLRPDKATRLRYDYFARAESLTGQGDFGQALTFYEQALEVAPDDPEVYLMLGMMHEALGDLEAAGEHYARAEQLFERREVFLASKSQQYYLIGWLAESEVAALEAIQLDDRYAIAYCSLGGAYEGQGRVAEALAAVQECASLAREQGQDQLYVIATSRQAMLMQMPLDPIPPGSQGQQDTQ
jgi:tetratricopeptide (TPR) repeat protein